jgi:hypothetical protein
MAARSSRYRLPPNCVVAHGRKTAQSRMHPPHHNHDPELAPGCSSMDSETQVYRTSENRTDQARKERLWRQQVGVTYVLTVVFTPGEGQVSISLESQAVSGAIGLLAVPAGAAGGLRTHLNGEPARPGGLSGDRQGGRRQRTIGGK